VTVPDTPVVSAEPEITEMARAADIGETVAIVRILQASGLVLLVSGWLLPWLVTPGANGVGQSAWDGMTHLRSAAAVLLLLAGLGAGLTMLSTAVELSRRAGPALHAPSRSTARTGAGLGALFLLVVLLLADLKAALVTGAILIGVVAAIAALAWSATLARRLPPRLSNPRGRLVLEVVALALAGIAALLVHGGDGALGRPGSDAYLNTPVWMTLTGLVLLIIADSSRPLLARNRRIALGLAIAAGIAFPFVFGHSADFIAWAAQSAAIYILLAQGLNVVVGFAGLLDLGYAAFFAIGAYVTAYLSSGRTIDLGSWVVVVALSALALLITNATRRRFGLAAWAPIAAAGAVAVIGVLLLGPASFHFAQIHLPFWVLIFLGASVAAMFGAVLGAPTLRLRGDYLAIVTLGFGEIVPDLARNNVFGLTGGPNGISAIDQPALPVYNHGHAAIEFGLNGANPVPYYATLLVLIALVVVVLRNVERSRLGRAWVAIREDEVAAAATGINTVTTKLLAFAIGASVSGFAGAFYGAIVGAITPEAFEFAVSVTALSTVVLGGIGSITGVTLGAVVISFLIYWVLPHLQGWMQTFGTTVHTEALATIDYSQYKYIAYGLILVAIMLLRPGGLLPSRARRVELQTGTESEALAAVSGTA
jgi:branched-chain amino acid transport system permease protein